jgi:type I restriction enzyme M protein
MPDQERLDDFIETLEGLGGSAKNPALQAALGWTADDYEAVKAELVARRIVVRGRGRSDSVSIVGAEAPVASKAPAGTTRKANASSTSSGPIGFEAHLWKAADALRNNMDAAEYKHVVLGLLFLKYISDAFEAKHAALEAEREQGADPEDPDQYRAENIFWVPKEARWAHLKARAPQPTIGSDVDEAMAAIERDNPSLKGVLPKDYTRPGLDKQRLGQVINLVSDIGLGEPSERARDTLGRVYEYFLSRFASAEGKSGGQFYTPTHVVRVLVEMLAPYRGRVYDPCCGSGGMFVQSEKFIEAHAGRIGDISIYGQESNDTTWRLTKATASTTTATPTSRLSHPDRDRAGRNPLGGLGGGVRDGPHASSSSAHLSNVLAASSAASASSGPNTSAGSSSPKASG